MDLPNEVTRWNRSIGSLERQIEEVIRSSSNENQKLLDLEPLRSKLDELMEKSICFPQNESFDDTTKKYIKNNVSRLNQLQQTLLQEGIRENERYIGVNGIKLRNVG